ncbi:MAG: TaqI-like C-terminal specificity domain-containing protein [Coriobacteriia bacterium]|jgi:hypothetical protein|nr:TaqI-like C-terminal specificity domain-containing protein [Coriobacteriia bacterium]
MEALLERIQEYGAVFTKPWMVDFMLDICGYTPDKDLARLVIVEPSCGDGSFLLPIVERLSEACRMRGTDIMDAQRAIRAFDLQPQHVASCRSSVIRWLSEDGWPIRTAAMLAETWVSCDDYLLRDPEPNAADFVVGNPPYVRAKSIPRNLRSAYVERCTAMTDGSDIYVGFFEVGLRALRPGGVLCFICADRWMRNTYGKRLRQLVSEHCNILAVYEMHGVDAFTEEVSAYPAVTLIGRGHQGPVRYAVAKPTFGAEAATRLETWAGNGSQPTQDLDFSATVLSNWFNTDDYWPTGSPARIALLRELENRLPLLEETGARVGIGIATGADDVFVTRADSMVEAERLLPLVRTADISGGRIVWQGARLVNPWDVRGALVRLEDHPRLAKYMADHSVRLRKRHVAKKDDMAWYRTIDKVIPGLLETHKLLLQDMKMTIEPVLDTGEYYPHHNLYWITPGGWDIRVLGGLLLSRVAEFFVSSYAVRMRGGTLRFQAQYLRRIRVPEPGTIPAGVASSLAAAFENRDADAATTAAMHAYGIDGIPD